MQKKRNHLTAWFEKRPINTKITILYAVVFSIALILLSIFVLLNASFFYRDISKNEIDEALAKVEKHIKAGGEITPETINELVDNANLEIIITVKGGTEPEFQKPNGFPPPIDTSSEPPPEKLRHSKTQMEMIQGKRYMSHQRIISYNGQSYIIQVFRPYYYEQRIIRIFLGIFIVVNILGIFCAYAIGRFISKRLLKPVVAVTEAARIISINDLSQRIEVPNTDDEIHELAVTFNNMIERLQNSVEKQKQFVSDASHELKTPISVIQGYANLISRWGKDDMNVLQESIDSITEETKSMTALINRLLFLAREDDDREVQFEDICLNDIISEINRELSVMDLNCSVIYNELDKVEVYGNSDLLKQMIWIFVENAIKYSKPEGGEIKLELLYINGKAHVIISDNGIGMKKSDIPFIFDRFYRGDKSRSNKTPGTGLGLSIAYKIIKKHNAKIEVRSEFGKYSIFDIEFN